MLSVTENLTELLEIYFIRNLILAIIVLITIKWIWKEIDLTIPLNILRIAILLYATLSTVLFVSGLLYPNSSGSDIISFYSRATGAYGFAYLLMIASNLLLPFLLLNKKLKHNLLFFFALAILMNIGRLFELFVIVVTSFHQDYL